MNTQMDEVVYLYLDDIIPNRFQPRENFDEKALNELAASIKEHGVIQPIIVRNIGSKYEIIAGERRYKASAIAGLTKIPAIVRNLDDKESAKVALLENLQRKNLSPIEEARTYQKILELDEMTQESLAKTMGKSQSAVANKIRLLTLPDEVQDALLKEKISERHARALLNVSDTATQVELLNNIIETRMTVRELEQEIQRLNNPTPVVETPIEAPITTSVETTVEPVELKEEKPKFFTFGFQPETTSENTEPESIPTPTVTSNLPMNNEPQEMPVATSTPDLTSNNESQSIPAATVTPDLDELRASAKDINIEKQIADLDSLLKLTEEDNETQEEPEKEEEATYKFVSVDPIQNEPVEEKIDTPSKLERLLSLPAVSVDEPEPVMDEEVIETNEQEVETLDFGTTTPPVEEEIEQPANILEEKITPLEIKEEAPREVYMPNLRAAINEVRNLVRNIEKSHFIVDSEEMDLEKEYQIVIKIQKED